MVLYNCHNAINLKSYANCIYNFFFLINMNDHLKFLMPNYNLSEVIIRRYRVYL